MRLIPLNFAFRGFDLHFIKPDGRQLFHPSISNDILDELVKRMRFIELQMIFNHLSQQLLIVLQRFVPAYVGITKFDHHRTDVLMLFLNGPFCAITQKHAQTPIVFRLIEGFTPKLLAEHGEIIRHGSFDFEA